MSNVTSLSAALGRIGVLRVMRDEMHKANNQETESKTDLKGTDEDDKDLVSDSEKDTNQNVNANSNELSSNVLDQTQLQQGQTPPQTPKRNSTISNQNDNQTLENLSSSAAGAATTPGPSLKNLDLSKPLTTQDLNDLIRSKHYIFHKQRCEYDVIHQVVKKKGWKSLNQPNNYSLMWIDTCAGLSESFSQIKPWQSVNHIPGLNELIARKSRLYRNIHRVAKILPKEYTFLPTTYVLPEDRECLYREEFQGSTVNGRCKNPNRFLILKPDHSAKGHGIRLTNQWDQIWDHLNDREKLRDEDGNVISKNSSSTGGGGGGSVSNSGNSGGGSSGIMGPSGGNTQSMLVVQRYIQFPMLLDDKKFDLRVYVLLNQVYPTMEVYVFRDGLVRLSTTTYERPNSDNIDKRTIHLTNYAVNKNSSDYEVTSDDDSGSKRSLVWFWNYIKEIYGEKDERLLWKKIKQLCVKTLLAVQPAMSLAYHSQMVMNKNNSIYNYKSSNSLQGSNSSNSSSSNTTPGVHYKAQSSQQSHLQTSESDSNQAPPPESLRPRCFELLGVDVLVDRNLRPWLLEINHLPSFATESDLDMQIKERLISQTLDLVPIVPAVLGKKLFGTKHFDKLWIDRKKEAESKMELYEKAYPIVSSQEQNGQDSDGKVNQENGGTTEASGNEGGGSKEGSGTTKEDAEQQSETSDDNKNILQTVTRADSSESQTQNVQNEDDFSLHPAVLQALSPEKRAERLAYQAASNAQNQSSHSDQNHSVTNQNLNKVPLGLKVRIDAVEKQKNSTPTTPSNSSSGLINANSKVTILTREEVLVQKVQDKPEQSQQGQKAETSNLSLLEDLERRAAETARRIEELKQQDYMRKVRLKWNINEGNARKMRAEDSLDGRRSEENSCSGVMEEAAASVEISNKEQQEQINHNDISHSAITDASNLDDSQISQQDNNHNVMDDEQQEQQSQNDDVTPQQTLQDVDENLNQVQSHDHDEKSEKPQSDIPEVPITASDQDEIILSSEVQSESQLNDNDITSTIRSDSKQSTRSSKESNFTSTNGNNQHLDINSNFQKNFNEEGDLEEDNENEYEDLDNIDVRNVVKMKMSHKLGNLYVDRDGNQLQETDNGVLTESDQNHINHNGIDHKFNDLIDDVNGLNYRSTTASGTEQEQQKSEFQADNDDELGIIQISSSDTDSGTNIENIEQVENNSQSETENESNSLNLKNDNDIVSAVPDQKIIDVRVNREAEPEPPSNTLIQKESHERMLVKRALSSSASTKSILSERSAQVEKDKQQQMNHHAKTNLSSQQSKESVATTASTQATSTTGSSINQQQNSSILLGRPPRPQSAGRNHNIISNNFNNPTTPNIHFGHMSSFGIGIQGNSMAINIQQQSQSQMISRPSSGRQNFGPRPPSGAGTSLLVNELINESENQSLLKREQAIMDEQERLDRERQLLVAVGQHQNLFGQDFDLKRSDMEKGVNVFQSGNSEFTETRIMKKRKMGQVQSEGFNLNLKDMQNLNSESNSVSQSMNSTTVGPYNGANSGASSAMHTPGRPPLPVAPQYNQQGQYQTNQSNVITAPLPLNSNQNSNSIQSNKSSSSSHNTSSITPVQGGQTTTSAGTAEPRNTNTTNNIAQGGPINFLRRKGSNSVTNNYTGASQQYQPSTPMQTVTSRKSSGAGLNSNTGPGKIQNIKSQSKTSSSESDKNQQSQHQDTNSNIANSGPGAGTDNESSASKDNLNQPKPKKTIESRYALISEVVTALHQSQWSRLYATKNRLDPELEERRIERKRKAEEEKDRPAWNRNVNVNKRIVEVRSGKIGNGMGIPQNVQSGRKSFQQQNQQETVTQTTQTKVQSQSQQSQSVNSNSKDTVSSGGGISQNSSSSKTTVTAQSNQISDKTDKAQSQQTSATQQDTSVTTTVTQVVDQPTTKDVDLDRRLNSVKDRIESRIENWRSRCEFDIGEKSQQSTSSNENSVQNQQTHTEKLSSETLSHIVNTMQFTAFNLQAPATGKTNSSQGLPGNNNITSFFKNQQTSSVTSDNHNMSQEPGPEGSFTSFLKSNKETSPWSFPYKLNDDGAGQFSQQQKVIVGPGQPQVKVFNNMTSSNSIVSSILENQSHVLHGNSNIIAPQAFSIHSSNNYSNFSNANGPPSAFSVSDISKMAQQHRDNNHNGPQMMMVSSISPSPTKQLDRGNQQNIDSPTKNSNQQQTLTLSSMVGSTSTNSNSNKSTNITNSNQIQSYQPQQGHPGPSASPIPNTVSGLNIGPTVISQQLPLSGSATKQPRSFLTRAPKNLSRRNSPGVINLGLGLGVQQTNNNSNINGVTGAVTGQPGNSGPGASNNTSNMIQNLDQNLMNLVGLQQQSLSQNNYQQQNVTSSMNVLAAEKPEQQQPSSQPQPAAPLFDGLIKGSSVASVGSASHNAALLQRLQSGGLNFSSSDMVDKTTVNKNLDLQNNNFSNFLKVAESTNSNNSNRTLSLNNNSNGPQSFMITGSNTSNTNNTVTTSNSNHANASNANQMNHHSAAQSQNHKTKVSYNIGTLLPPGWKPLGSARIQGMGVGRR